MFTLDLQWPQLMLGYANLTESQIVGVQALGRAMQ
jgi:hypothetical protein